MGYMYRIDDNKSANLYVWGSDKLESENCYQIIS